MRVSDLHARIAGSGRASPSSFAETIRVFEIPTGQLASIQPIPSESVRETPVSHTTFICIGLAGWLHRSDGG